MRHKIAGFYHVLSVSMVSSVSVESAMESNDALIDMFLNLRITVQKKKKRLPLRCRLRQAQRGRDLLATEASRRHALYGETLLCG